MYHVAASCVEVIERLGFVMSLLVPARNQFSMFEAVVVAIFDFGHCKIVVTYLLGTKMGGYAFVGFQNFVLQSSTVMFRNYNLTIILC